MNKILHGFDLWGVTVNQIVMGPRVMDTYAELMEGSINPSVAQNLDNYQKVLDGVETGSKKKDYVKAIEKVVWPAFFEGKIDVDFNGGLYEDALSSMDGIVTAGQNYCIITTGDSQWIKIALSQADKKLANSMEGLYHGSKSTPEPFLAAAKGNTLVSHTEDQLKGFTGLIKSGIEEITTVYVERLNLATQEHAKAAGINMYVKGLNEVPYVEIGKNQ